jgi:predicted dehydrogenase
MPDTEVLQRFCSIAAVEPPALQEFAGVAYLMQDLAFLRALWTKTRPSPGIEVGLEAQRLAEAAYLSARCGEPVALPTPSTSELRQSSR